MENWLNVSKLKAPNGVLYTTILKSEAKRLVDLINKYMREMYFGNPPVTDVRTGRLMTYPYFQVKPDIFINGTRLSITIILYPALHKSMFSSEQVNVIKLLNWGYRVKKDVWFKNKKNFGYRKGYGFIQKAVNEFNATNKYGIVVNTSSIKVKDYHS